MFNHVFTMQLVERDAVRFISCVLKELSNGRTVLFENLVRGCSVLSCRGLVEAPQEMVKQSQPTSDAITSGTFPHVAVADEAAAIATGQTPGFDFHEIRIEARTQPVKR
jgi:hypothetical protein